jgi:hypothetical protein
MVQKEVIKLFQWFWKGFLKWYDGGEENGITSKRIFEVEIFLLSKYWLPLLFEETLGDFFLFSMLRLLGTWGFLMIFTEKITSSKTSFQMAWHGHDYGYTGGERIFWNGVMHANIAKPWL